MVRDQAYERYIRDISGYPRIDAKREAELSKIIMTSRSKKKVDAAVTEMVQANYRLVLHCLKEFSGFLTMPDVALTRMDLIAEGNIALMNAAQKFNAAYVSDDKSRPKRTIRFSTYACKSIKCAMRRALRLSKFIHIPENHFSYWAKISSLKQRYNRVTDEMVIDELEITETKLEKLKMSQDSHTACLEDFTMDDDSSHWSDTMEDVRQEDPGSKVGNKDLRRHLIREMTTLPDRTRKMLFSMFLSNNLATLGDLSQRFGVSKERCRQICARGLQLLRRRLEDQWGQTGDLAAFGVQLQALTKASMPEPAAQDFALNTGRLNDASELYEEACVA